MSAVGAERAEVAVELLRLTPRLVTEDGMRDRQHALLCIQEYQRFLTLAEVHRGVALTPSANVEAVWERHLLDTEAYFTDSEAVFGRGAYAHRFEHAQGAGPNDCVYTTPEESFAATLKLYEARYDAPACADAWGEAGKATLRFLPEHDAAMGGVASGEARWALFKRPQDDKTQADNSFRNGRTPLAEVDLDWLGQAVAAELPLKQRVCKNFAPLAQIAVDDPAAAVEEYRCFLQMLVEDGEDGWFTPSKLVDELWHRHMLRSTEYFAFCGPSRRDSASWPVHAHSVSNATGQSRAMPSPR